MPSEERVYFLGYVAHGQMYVAPLGTDYDAPAAMWVHCGEAPGPLAQAAGLLDLHTMPPRSPATPHQVTAPPPPITVHDAQPSLAHLMDGAGKPLVAGGQAEWPLWDTCRHCQLAVRRTDPASRWRHFARCQHCATDIVQLVSSTVWVTLDGFTLCAKTPEVGGPQMRHQPMPVVT